MEINYGGILLAAVINFAFGALWYGPLFGKTWMHLAGLSHDDMKSMKLTARQAMVLGFVSAFIFTFVLSYLVGATGAAGIPETLALAVWIWLGFVVTTLAGGVLWENKSVKLFGFNIFYQLISLLITAAVLSVQ